MRGAEVKVAGGYSFPTEINMLGVISQGGGQCKSLGRHAVSALLTAGSGLNVRWPSGITNVSELYTALRNTFLSGNCESTFAEQVKRIAEDDHGRCGQVIPATLPRGIAEPTIITSAKEAPIEMANTAVTVSSFPNPYTDRVTFTVKTSVSGMASFELFGLLGEKVSQLYTGHLDAKGVKTLIYNAPQAQRKTLIYRLTVGGKVVTGKVLYIN